MKCFLRSFDFNLNKLNKIEIEFFILEYFLETCNDKLFIMYRLENYNCIKIYNSNLDFLENVGQMNPDLPFYIPICNPFLVCDDFYLIIYEIQYEIARVYE